MGRLKRPIKLLARITLATVALLIAYVFCDYLYGWVFLKTPAVKSAKTTSNRLFQSKPDSPADFAKVTQFDLSIAKLGLSVAVTPNVDGLSSDIYTQALKSGVAHYKGTAMPASGSNVVIFGHSSGNPKIPFSKVFAKLNNLKINDQITIKFNGKSYTYAVASKKVVAANDFSVAEPTEIEQLTLLTCWPIGTDKSRLVVVANPVH